VAVAAIALSGCAAGGADAGGGDDAVTGDTITVGALLPLSGAAANYGPVYQGGIEAYVEHVNETGGIGGKQIELKVYDNGYDPAKSLAAARKAVTEDDVFAFVSTPGTPVNDAVARYLDEQGVPNLFVITGAPQFNDPEKAPLIFPFQLSYSAEPELIWNYLQEEQPDAKIGVLYQNDDFGKSFQRVFEKVAGDAIVAQQPYESSDSDVSSQISALKAAGADVVVSFVLAKFAILSMRAMNDTGWDAPLIISSNANDPAVLSEAGADALEGTIAGSSFPSTDSDDEAVTEYRELMAKYSPSTPVGTSSMQTYGATKLFMIALEAAGENPTRESLVDAVKKLTDVPGMPVIGEVSVTEKNHDAISCMAMTRYNAASTFEFISDPICAD
jgi:ABC-type branched-subunit amino acid transport system substrate-binding protein